jgi:hypothetical protein
MAEIKLLRDSSLNTVIDKNAALSNNARAAGDYDNSTELDLWCDAYLQVQYDGGPPAVGTKVADLYVLFGDGAGTQLYPDGGDGTVGQDDTPQATLYVGSFLTVNPSTSVNELLQIKHIPLCGHGNRFVLVNTSGQTFDSTWELRVKPTKVQSA